MHWQLVTLALILLGFAAISRRVEGSPVTAAMDEAAFIAAARYDVSQSDPDLVDDYDRAGPYWHHFSGIDRYWRKKREAA